MEARFTSLKFSLASAWMIAHAGPVAPLDQRSSFFPFCNRTRLGNRLRELGWPHDELVLQYRHTKICAENHPGIIQAHDQ